MHSAKHQVCDESVPYQWGWCHSPPAEEYGWQGCCCSSQPGGEQRPGSEGNTKDVLLEKTQVSCQRKCWEGAPGTLDVCMNKKKVEREHYCPLLVPSHLILQVCICFKLKEELDKRHVSPLWNGVESAALGLRWRKERKVYPCTCSQYGKHIVNLPNKLLMAPEHHGGMFSLAARQQVCVRVSVVPCCTVVTMLGLHPASSRAWTHASWPLSAAW